MKYVIQSLIEIQFLIANNKNIMSYSVYIYIHPKKILFYKFNIVLYIVNYYYYILILLLLHYIIIY